MTDERQEIGKAEAFYTGGGIWISMVFVDENTYYAIDNDYPCLSKYDHRNEEDLFFNLLDSKAIEDLDESEKAIFCELKKTLDETMF